MVGVLILTHGRMADELLAAARKIAGELEAFDALSLGWTDTLEEAQSKVKEALDRLNTGEGVLVLTDIFGGTPSNVAMGFLEPANVEVVSGVNLPMVVRLGCLRATAMPVAELSNWIRDKGRASICSASSVPRRLAAAAPKQDCEDP